MLTEIRPYQTDLAVYGKLFSLAFILFFLGLTIAGVFHFTGIAKIYWIYHLPSDVWDNVRKILVVLGF